MIVDSAICVDGRRSAPRSLEGTHDACHDRGGFAWIGLYEPTEEEFASVTGEFELHPLAVEDAIKAHQRPKVEHYGDAIFVVLKSGPLPGGLEDGGVRRDPRIPRRRFRCYGSPWRSVGPGRCAPSHGERARAAPPGPGGDPLRDHGSDRRRLHSGGRGP